MNEPAESPSVFAPLWRRKWLILLVAVLVAAGTYVYYNRKPHVYGASTELFLASGAEEQAQVNGSASAGKKASSVNPTTAVALINSSVIKEATKARLHKQHKTAATRAALKGKATATNKEKSEFITITTRARRAAGAVLLANTTAQTFIDRQSASHRRAVQTAISLAHRQLRRIESSQALNALPAKAKKPGKGTEASSEKSTEKPVSTGLTIQAANLSAKINQLEADLYVTGIKQIDPAKRRQAQLLSPKPRQNAIFGFVMGLVLAAFAAYALSRFDRRLRSIAAIERVFQSPILTALPATRRPIVSQEGVPALSKLLRESIRRLHVSIGLAAANARENGGPASPRSLLFVSADPGDGKSTVLAGLALVEREAGKRVALVEADFRRPVQARLLKVPEAEGLVGLVEGRLSLEGSIQRVAPIQSKDDFQPEASRPAGLATLVKSSESGSLSVLLGSRNVNDPPALLARPIVAATLLTLAEDFDQVLVDGPGPLSVTDVMPLLGLVDGIVIVARFGHTSESSAQRLVQLLARSRSAPVLGVVANAVPRREISKYGLGAEGRAPWHRRLLGR